jgi:hypothetical protein
MKKIIITLTMIVAVFSFISCDKESEDIATGIVYYPVFTNSGNELNVVALGESFTVPEVTVTDNGVDITSQAVITGTVDLTTPGYYAVNYTAESADGYVGTYAVIVFVYDPNYKEAPIAGDYKGSLAAIGGGPVVVSEYNKGVYKIDDAFCGYYNVYRGFGSVYTAPGYLIYVGGNEFILRNCTSVWGPVLDTDGVTYNPTTGVLDWVNINDGYTWGGNSFNITPVVE